MRVLHLPPCVLYLEGRSEGWVMGAFLLLAPLGAARRPLLRNTNTLREALAFK